MKNKKEQRQTKNPPSPPFTKEGLGGFAFGGREDGRIDKT